MKNRVQKLRTVIKGRKNEVIQKAEDALLECEFKAYTKTKWSLNFLDTATIHATISPEDKTVSFSITYMKELANTDIKSYLNSKKYNCVDIAEGIEEAISILEDEYVS